MNVHTISTGCAYALRTETILKFRHVHILLLVILPLCVAAA